ncbi:unnamed protein product, partial [Mesorhabditis spiculigera]
MSPTLARDDPKRFHALEFGCGWGAGCIETCLMYPVSKISFRQQVLGYNIMGALKDIKNEGFPLLYRGLMPPLIMRTTSRAVMFGLYDKFLTSFGGTKYIRGSPIITKERAQAAFMAGTCEATMAPLERIQVLLQAKKYNSVFKNTGDAFINILKEHGIRECYRGISLVVARNGLSNIMYFNLRGPCKLYIMDKAESENSHFLHIIGDFISGALLGATISTVFFPLNVVKNNVQSGLGKEAESPRQALRRILKERGGIRQLYRGVHVNAFRSLCGWGITTAAYEGLLRFGTNI